MLQQMKTRFEFYRPEYLDPKTGFKIPEKVGLSENNYWVTFRKLRCLFGKSS